MALRKGRIRPEEYDLNFVPNVSPGKGGGEPEGNVRYELLGIKDLINGGDLKLDGDGEGKGGGGDGKVICIDGDIDGSVWPWIKEEMLRAGNSNHVAKLLVRKGGWIDAHADEEFKILWNVEAVEWRTNGATWVRRPGRQDDCCSECSVYKHQRGNRCHLHFVGDKGGYVGDSEGFCHHVSCSVVQ